MSTQKTKNKLSAKESLLAWSDHAWDDYLYWQQKDAKKMEEINRLLEECKKDPFRGTGKPEPLKGSLTGFWSRRIDREHRLVYLPEDGNIYVVACRYHYASG
ncbi:Txe/YoeB family addiction module toxin [Paludibacterium purpuratum]|uniref:Putative mRNA interferase YoeB n=1 Tax=Paludibacterium purpuratum TaxID=1144873 RepID=A0A4V3DUR0_9NEIS|nr:Txe/YoeB family addiction module toxin [Paludibacterium purpuratum]TDR76437.1 toxin YoeB [Paludibacterium purpuratum]